MRASKETRPEAWPSAFRSERSEPVLLAGPCHIETETQLLETAQHLKNVQANGILKVCIWESNARPGNTEDMASMRLTWLRKVKEKTGLRTACAVSNALQAEEALAYDVDILCINGHTTVNPFAVQEIADALRGTTTPVLVSNPVYPNLGLWLGAFERLRNAGLQDLGAIHDGFAAEDRALYHHHPKWEFILGLRNELPEMPILCDASTIAGKRSLLYPVAQRALAYGINGLVLDVNLSTDGRQHSRQELMLQELDLLLNALQTNAKLPETTVLVDQLDTLRQKIETLDDELLELLLQRAALAGQVSSYGLGNTKATQLNNSEKQLQISRLLAQGNSILSGAFVAETDVYDSAAVAC
ncbi:chorismate mutase [Pontibacter arcticus]|uniref:chorismate mutase n=1 Tax=Pontibacter arcticus TaxID=2080288 RepID=A0A364RB94_9BACT|nr:chorismate mutase [Pontibacter arcticus]RAU81601.1 3-deoxy-7-phosphoheptulonate synthase [Pontibacter arcticus]